PRRSGRYSASSAPAGLAPGAGGGSRPGPPLNLAAAPDRDRVGAGSRLQLREEMADVRSHGALGYTPPRSRLAVREAAVDQRDNGTLLPRQRWAAPVPGVVERHSPGCRFDHRFPPRSASERQTTVAPFPRRPALPGCPPRRMEVTSGGSRWRV